MTLGCSLSLSRLHFSPTCKGAIDMTSLTPPLQLPPWSDLWATWLPFVPQIEHTCSCLRVFALVLPGAYRLTPFHSLNLSLNVSSLAKGFLVPSEDLSFRSPCQSLSIMAPAQLSSWHLPRPETILLTHVSHSMAAFLASMWAFVLLTIVTPVPREAPATE